MTFLHMDLVFVIHINDVNLHCRFLPAYWIWVTYFLSWMQYQLRSGETHILTHSGGCTVYSESELESVYAKYIQLKHDPNQSSEQAFKCCIEDWRYWKWIPLLRHYSKYKFWIWNQTVIYSLIISSQKHFPVFMLQV